MAGAMMHSARPPFHVEARLRALEERVSWLVFLAALNLVVVVGIWISFDP